MQVSIINRRLLSAALSLGVIGFTAQAHAVQSIPLSPGYCSTATASEGISVGNTKINGTKSMASVQTTAMGW